MEMRAMTTLHQEGRHGSAAGARPGRFFLHTSLFIVIDLQKAGQTPASTFIARAGLDDLT